MLIFGGVAGVRWCYSNFELLWLWLLLVVRKEAMWAQHCECTATERMRPRGLKNLSGSISEWKSPMHFRAAPSFAARLVSTMKWTCAGLGTVPAVDRGNDAAKADADFTPWMRAVYN
jgi:hypothetical protein